MIGSFWNLCRACPSMPVDKLHSEYRSTYRWHEFTGSSRPEVVRRAPAPNPSQFIGATNEPPLPRRKKCPELAYKSHEFIIGTEYTDSRNNANRMARSEERGGTPSRRSKSEGPPAVPNGRAYAIPKDDGGYNNKQAGESNGLFKKTITKLSTEYRLQFVWPNVRRIKGQVANNRDTIDEHPKKSISLGAIKANQQLRQHQQTVAALPTVHKKRTTNQNEATQHELEPLVGDAEEKKPNEKQVNFAEKKAPRIFSQTFDQERINHFITKKENFGFDTVDNKQTDGGVMVNGTAPPHSHPNLELWLKEAVELRKKAEEYKTRGWGTEIDPELYKKQKDLWEQVSKRSSLSALSLASSVHKPITKEEKDQENNKKSVPNAKSTHKPRVPGQALMIDNKDEVIPLPARFHHIRHHLERTTGPDVEDGALLPSPTREKLMPAITKRESESQRGSPKKIAASRHGSPQKGSPQKSSPKKVTKNRSQSVGPEKESPKRRVRSVSTAPTTKANKKGTSTPYLTAGTTTTERKARPSDGEEGRATAISISSASPQPVPEVPEEPLIKSPPEPTRVKSPEQIIMRSPDPVNWTVPLDTGKTFTVTQNVKDGETYSRPQSEIKASTPVEKPPPPPQSAPPEFTEQIKMDAWKHANLDPKSSISSNSPTSSVALVVTAQPAAGGMAARYEAKPVPGSTLRCLEDPRYDMDSGSGYIRASGHVTGTGTAANISTSSTSTTTNTASTARSAASDVLEKARDRFDRFWGGNKEEKV